jgi:hypothetical protein
MNRPDAHVVTNMRDYWPAIARLQNRVANNCRDLSGSGPEAACAIDLLSAQDYSENSTDWAIPRQPYFEIWVVNV